MIDSLKPMVLAVDGGGTRCRIAASGDRGRMVVETGSANVSTNFSASVGELLDGLSQLAAQAGLHLDQLADLPAYVGLAGVTGPDVADRLAAALPLRNLRINDDRPAALRGALGQRSGFVTHCGTGSFFAAQIGEKTLFAGGWGSVLGDEASAQWVGRRALAITLEQVDGRAARSRLSDELLADYDGSAGIVRFAGSASPADFGVLARTVTSHAEDGDVMAIGILQSGADEIARSLSALGWTTDLSICLTGGIGPSYKTYLPGEMQAKLIAPQGEPLDGALSLARDLERETAHGRG